MSPIHHSLFLIVFFRYDRYPGNQKNLFFPLNPFNHSNVMNLHSLLDRTQRLLSNFPFDAFDQLYQQ